MRWCWEFRGADWNKYGPLHTCENCDLASLAEQLAVALIHLYVHFLHNASMLKVQELSAQDFVSLSPTAAAELAAHVLAHVSEQSRQIES